MVQNKWKIKKMHLRLASKDSRFCESSLFQTYTQFSMAKLYFSQVFSWILTENKYCILYRILHSVIWLRHRHEWLSESRHPLRPEEPLSSLCHHSFCQLRQLWFINARCCMLCEHWKRFQIYRHESFSTVESRGSYYSTARPVRH